MGLYAVTVDFKAYTMAWKNHCRQTVSQSVFLLSACFFCFSFPSPLVACSNAIPIIVFGSAALLLDIHQFLRAFINKPSFTTLTTTATTASLCACLVRTVAALLATIAKFLQVCCLHLNRRPAALAAGSSVYANSMSARLSNKHNAAATWELMKRYKYSHTYIHKLNLIFLSTGAENIWVSSLWRVRELTSFRQKIFLSVMKPLPMYDCSMA